MFSLELLLVLAAVVVGIIVCVGALLLAGGNLKAALMLVTGLVLGTSMLMVEHPNAFSILLACAFIMGGIWLMNVERNRDGQKEQKK